MALTKNEEKIWQQLMDYYNSHEFAFGKGSKVPIEENKVNKSFINKLVKWLLSSQEENEDYKKFLMEFLKTKKGSFQIPEHYLWDYLIDKQE